MNAEDTGAAVCCGEEGEEETVADDPEQVVGDEKRSPENVD